jgi:serine/threonine-protein kinase RsbT
MAEDAVWMRQRALELATRWGSGPVAASAVAIAVSELVTNAALHAGGGELVLAVQPRGDRVGIEVLVEDRGPGIADVEAAVQDSVAESEVRRSSLGAGLGAVHRLMDEVMIEARPRGGTRVRALKWLAPR